LRAQTDFLREVPDTPATYAALARHNTMSPLSSLVYDASTRQVRFACSFPLRAEIADFSGLIFSWAAATQASAASLLLDSDVARQIGGEPAVSSHPTSGFRSHPDDMLTLIHRELVPRGEVDSGFAEADFQELAATVRHSGSVLTNAGPTGLTAEFPFGGYTGLFRKLFGPKGKPHTALLTVKADRHPLLGNGCFIRLFLPLADTTERLVHLINRMNRFETEEWAYVYGIGGWCLEQTAGGWTGVCHVTFLPVVLRRGNVLQNFLAGSYSRMLAVKERFKLKAPGRSRSAQDVDLDTVIRHVIQQRGANKRKGRP